MKRIRFTLALLSAGWLAGASISTACDHCHKHGSKCACKKDCDDRGLLNVVDRVAGNIQHGLKHSLPKLDLDIKLHGKHLGNACDATCDSSPDCGCEIHGTPACGCEMGEHATHHHAPAEHYGQGTSIRETHESPPMPRMVPPTPLATPVGPRSPSFDSQSPKPVRVIPHNLPSNPQQPNRQLPDSMVNPFGDDESASVRRPTPASPATFQRPTNRYRESYDPQASRVYRVKLIDSDEPSVGPKLAPSVTTASAEFVRDGAATHQSSESGSANSDTATSSRRSQLIRKQSTASNNELDLSSSSSPAPIVQREVERLPVRSDSSLQSDYYANPLRP